MDSYFHPNRRAQPTLFDSILGVVQPAALLVAGAAVVNLERPGYAIALAIAVGLLVFGQYVANLRNQSDRARDLLEDYLQNRSNLLSVLVGIATHAPGKGPLTKHRIVGGIEVWFDEDLTLDYYLDQEEGRREVISFRRKPWWKRLWINPKQELKYKWWSVKAMMRNQPSVELIDIVFHTPNEDIASIVIARGLEEQFIEERLRPGVNVSSARIEYVWTSMVLIEPSSD